jgi:hypothetical protein
MTRHGMVTAELVGRKFFFRGPGKDDFGKWAAYRRLRALEDLGLILRDKSHAHPAEVLRVTREGARIADVGIRPAPLVHREVPHALAVVWLVEYLLLEHPGAELTTEREIRADRYRSREAFQRGGESNKGRAADAILRIPADGPGAQGVITVAVELDLSRKDRRAMEDMIRRYNRARFDRIWWYVKPPRVARTREFVREMRADDRIEVRAWRG